MTERKYFTIYVAVDGNDANDGLTRETPVTYEHGIQIVYDAGGGIVHLLPGVYDRRAFGEEKSR